MHTKFDQKGFFRMKYPYNVPELNTSGIFVIKWNGNDINSTQTKICSDTKEEFIQQEKPKKKR